MADRHAIIVGGGVTGLSTAYHLKRLGYGDVTVFEKDTIGAGSSSRAAGISTGLLWTKTGILARKTALRRFREMSRELNGYVFHNEHGCLGLFSPELWPGREALLPLYDEFDVPYQVLSADEIKRRWPMLKPPDDYLGVLDPLGGYSEPPEYLAALTAKLEATGRADRRECDGSELVLEGDRAVGVRHRGRGRQADAVVVANYAWVLPLLKTADIAIPAKTFLHRRYVSKPMAAPFVAPPVNADPFVGYVRPADGNRILIGAETPDRDDMKVSEFGFRLDEIADDPALRERWWSASSISCLPCADWNGRRARLDCCRSRWMASRSLGRSGAWRGCSSASASIRAASATTRPPATTSPSSLPTGAPRSTSAPSRRTASEPTKPPPTSRPPCRSATPRDAVTDPLPRRRIRS